MRFRFEIHDRSLPGTPDIVLYRHKVAIFVHGVLLGTRTTADQVEACLLLVPNSGKRKKEAKVARDRRAEQQPFDARVLTIWECQIRDGEKLKKRLKAFISGKQR